MGRKLGTSDLHLGHTNIVKFTNRIEAMDRRMDIGIDAHPSHGIFNLEELVGEKA